MLSKEQLETQLARKSPEWWTAIQQNKGRENYYYDSHCKSGIVTIDRDAGVTPMAIACRKEGCSGVMLSAGYPDPRGKPAWLGEPSWEWYRPDEIDDDAEDDPEADHVMDGGLLLREVAGE